MIKFFRRIRQQLLASNRFSKYLLYAIGEIVLVMVGILLALQVNNWNEERKDRVQENIILNNLLIECKTNIGEVQAAINKRKAALNANSRLQKLIYQNEIIILNSEIDSLIGLSRYITTLDPKSGVKEEIINSAKIELIRNAEIRKFVTEWNASIVNLSKIEDGLANIVINQFNPFLIKHLTIKNSDAVILNNLMKRNKEEWVNWYPIQSSKHKFDYHKFLNTPELESYISHLTTWRIGAQFYTESLYDRLVDAIQLIEEEIGKQD